MSARRHELGEGGGFNPNPPGISNPVAIPSLTSESHTVSTSALRPTFCVKAVCQSRQKSAQTVGVDPRAVAQSLCRLAHNPYSWLAGLSRGLGLLMA